MDERPAARTHKPVIVGEGDYRYEVIDNWAKLPDGWSFTEVGGGRRRPATTTSTSSTAASIPMMVFDRDGNFLRSWGEGVFPRAARRAHGAGRHDLPHRRRRPHRCASARLDGKVLLTLGMPGQAGAVHERRAVPPLHAHGAVAEGRHLRLGRLRQRARAQILARTASCCSPGASPAREPGQFNLPHNIYLRRRRLGLCRRPREPPRAGVRRQRQVRDAVEQPAPPVRPVHAAGQVPRLLHRRTRPRHRDEQRTIPISGRGSASSITPASFLPARNSPGRRGARRIPGAARHRGGLPRRSLCGRSLRGTMGAVLARCSNAQGCKMLPEASTTRLIHRTTANGARARRANPEPLAGLPDAILGRDARVRSVRGPCIVESTTRPA